MAGGERLLAPLREAARQAAAAIMAVYAGDFAVRRKADRSPVTLADERAEEILVEALGRLTPGVPVIAEEAVAATGAPEKPPDVFWLVDPLDGTKEFVARTGKFTINLGLVEKRRPVLGLVHAPAQDLTFAAAEGAAFRRRGDEAAEAIAARPPPSSGLVVVHSRSHGNNDRLAAYLAGLRIAQRRRVGSALEFCLLASGEADLYPRFGPTSEWDTAAGQAVLEAAGGAVRTLDGAPLRYGKPGFLNHSFVASGLPAGLP